MTGPAYTAGGEQHRYSLDDDRCRCGGCWVYFDEEGTHGCEAAGPPPAELVLDGYGRQVDDADDRPPTGWDAD